MGATLATPGRRRSGGGGRPRRRGRAGGKADASGTASVEGQTRRGAITGPAKGGKGNLATLPACPIVSCDDPRADHRRDSAAAVPAGLGPAPVHRARRTGLAVHTGPAGRVYELAVPDERPRRRRGRAVYDRPCE